MGGYDEAYEGAPALFGDEPEPILSRFVGSIPSGAPVLDIGAGQGRNALFLARQGREVVALDPSSVAVASIAAIAEAEGLPCRAAAQGYEEHLALPGTYGAVLVFGLLQILDRPGIDALVTRVRGWTRRGGLVFVTAFSTEDEGHRACAARWRRIARGSFADETGEVRTYLEPGEVVEVFDGLEVLHHHEGPGPVHRHGDGPPEQHAMIEAVFRAVPLRLEG